MASITYTGKEQRSAVVAKDDKGNIIGSKNYTVSYSNNKNVRQAAVTVAFHGSYTGTVQKTFTILPKGTAISKVTPKKKGLTIRWTKQTAQTTGYKIQCFTSSKVIKKKTITVIVG